MSEHSLIAWLRNRIQITDPAVLTGVGPDDCAILDASAMNRLAISTDMLVEGTHFDQNIPAQAIGFKAMAAAASDLAASGCRPRWALCALGLRRGLGTHWAREFGEGLISCAEDLDISLVGGDTTSTDGPVSICVTVCGQPLAGGPVTRGNAKPGDAILVTGSLGGSIQGRHLRPVVRLQEIEALLNLAQVNACMDITDGLAMDLWRMMQESSTGAILEAEAIPLSPAALDLSKESGKSPLEHALRDGEDFELLVCLQQDDWPEVAGKWPEFLPNTPLTRIGEVTSEKSLWLAGKDGQRQELLPQGYEHDF